MPNRYDKEKSSVFIPQNEDYFYTADESHDFLCRIPDLLEMLIVVNPDNPSGNYIPKCDLLRLCEWARKKGMRLLIDESFCDFSDEEDTDV